jgi:hypothetical protein
MKITLNPQGYARLLNCAIDFRNELADTIKDQAKDIVPVRTGALRDSIIVENDKDYSHITAKSNYAAFVELGTRNMPAQPYMLPALLNIKDYMLKGKTIVLPPSSINPQNQPTLDMPNNEIP